MAILNPLVSFLSKYKIPRALSVLLSYLIFIGTIAGAIAGIVPPLVDQTSSFVNNFPEYIQNIGVSSSLGEQIVNNLASQLSTVPTQAARFTISVFSNLLGVFTVLVFAFYMLLARDRLEDQLAYLFGNEKKKKIGMLIDKLEEKLGGWARGQLTLMLLIGVSSYVGLRLLGIPFALPLAILAGLFEAIPYLGPILSAVPAVILGFGISPIMGFATLALYFLIQQVENYLFVPKVMEKSVGVSPIITLFALAVGFRIAGIVGIIISVPVVITIQVLSREYIPASK
jgi:predicted PurR-regulated permease PerM